MRFIIYMHHSSGPGPPASKKHCHSTYDVFECSKYSRYRLAHYSCFHTKTLASSRRTSDAYGVLRAIIVQRFLLNQALTAVHKLN